MTTRFLVSSQEALAQQPLLAFRVLADIGVTSSTMYGCTGLQYIYTMGNTYTPVGPFGGFDPVVEDSDAFPRAMRLWGTAINSSNLYEPLRESMFGRPVKLWRTFLDPATNALVNTPEPMFGGQIDGLTLKFGDAQRGNFYELEVSNELKRMPAAAYFNYQTLLKQAAANSGSTFYEFMYQIPGYKAQWGQQASTAIFPDGRPSTEIPAPNVPWLPWTPG